MFAGENESHIKKCYHWPSIKVKENPMRKPLSQADIKAYKKLGNRYRKLRLAKGMTQEDVIDHGFSVRHYQQLEAGRSHTLTTLFKLAEMFGVQASELLEGVWE